MTHNILHPARKSGPSASVPSIDASPSAMLALAGIGLMAGAMPAQAQDSGQILVTGLRPAAEMESDKSTAPLLDTPQTVSVVPEDVIRERAARTLSEVLRNTPGISFNAGENGFGTDSSNFSLRGFDTSGSVFTDNARDSGSYARDVFNVESVEVVKGAAADNGRGSAGGYVNVNTKRAQLDGFVAGDVSFGFDDYDGRNRKRASVDVNQPLGDTVAVRLNAVVEDSGIAGREYAKNELWGIAPSLAVGLGAGVRAYLSWEHMERNDLPDWGVSAKTIEGTVNYNPQSAAAPRDAFYGLLTDCDDANSDAVFGRIEADLAAGITLSSQVRWSQVDRSARFTTPTQENPLRAFDEAPTQTLFYARENESLTSLTNLAAKFDTGGIGHSLAMGVELSWESSTSDRQGSAGGAFAPGVTDLFDPNPGRVGAAPFAPTQTAEVDVDTIAFYLYDTISLNKQFEITGGVRGESYKATISDSNGGPADNFETSPFVWNGKIGLVYKPTASGSLYASFGTSALPPGSFLSNSDISRTGDNAFPGLVAGAAPIRAHNYEVGVKWDLFSGALSTTAALFHTEKRNVPVVGVTDEVEGYQKLVVRGFEVGVTGQITPEWSVFAGALISDSERKIDSDLAAIQRAANSGDFPGEYANWAIDGDELAFTPDLSVTLWTTYRFPFGLTLGGGLQHVGSSFVGRPDDAQRVIPNGRYGELPGYTLLNAMVSYDLTENVDLRLNVDNITNKKYATSLNWNAWRASLGAPRTYLVSLGFRF